MPSMLGTKKRASDKWYTTQTKFAKDRKRKNNRNERKERKERKEMSNTAVHVRFKMK